MATPFCLLLVGTLILCFYTVSEAMPMMDMLAPVGAALPDREEGLAETGPAPGMSMEDKADYLLVLVGKKATLKLANASDPHGKATLTMRDVPATTLWFTDMPVRRAGQVRTARLAAPSAAGFWAAQPNAALTGSMEGMNDTCMVVMSATSPTYRGGNLTLDLVLQDPSPLGPNARPVKLTRQAILLESMESNLMVFPFMEPELELEDVSLFVDVACYSGLFVHACDNGYGESAWGVGLGPWHVGGASCPTCGGGWNGPYFG
eukprot:jgi/Botrbrau1/7995/Bobra.384_2s0023.1